MTRTTDEAIARAFWWVIEGHQAPLTESEQFILDCVKEMAEAGKPFDAESPAGTECKICGGGNVYCAACMSKSAPEVTVNSERVQIPAESTHVRCPKCTAHMPVGKWCGGAQCPLRK